MHEMAITQEMYDRAAEKAKALGVLKGSIRRGAGNIYGFLGEEIFLKLYPHAVRVNEESHDFELEGLRVDVKTKMCSSQPLMHYEASVTYAKTPQDCDIYFFVRVHKDTRIGWALGWQLASNYIRSAALKKKGEVDPANGMVCHKTCWNLPYSDMFPPDSLFLFRKTDSDRKSDDYDQEETTETGLCQHSAFA